MKDESEMRSKETETQMMKKTTKESPNIRLNKMVLFKIKGCLKLKILVLFNTFLWCP